jgi:hypothetical protein
MIKGFEDITYNLTATELKIYIPLIIKDLMAHQAENLAISNQQICDALYEFRIRKYKERHGHLPKKGIIQKNKPLKNANNDSLYSHTQPS